MLWGLRSKKRDRRWKREVVEDALKIIYEEDRGEKGATVEFLSQKLHISRQVGENLIRTLKERGLVAVSEGNIHLTAAGRALGMHLLRAHRLYERYLADDTGIPLKDVHRMADRKEHFLSQTEVQSLEARLGFPVSDPHGDGIPDEQGQLREAQPPCVPLNQWPPGIPGEIVHIEDEPESAFAQILSWGIFPGSKVIIQEISERGIRLTADGNDLWLAPALAGQIEVSAPRWEGEEWPGPARTLADLQPGEKVRVRGIAPSVRGLARRRLLDLGFTRGARVEAVLKSTFGGGDPTAFRIRGTVIALRKEQAEQIFIQPMEE